MTKKNLAVLFGGCSPEYPVSLQSASAVLEHIDRSRYHVLPIGINFLPSLCSHFPARFCLPHANIPLKGGHHHEKSPFPQTSSAI